MHLIKMLTLKDLTYKMCFKSQKMMRFYVSKIQKQRHRDENSIGGKNLDMKIHSAVFTNAG